jgi:hypothetical protein
MMMQARKVSLMVLGGSIGIRARRQGGAGSSVVWDDIVRGRRGAACLGIDAVDPAGASGDSR